MEDGRFFFFRDSKVQTGHSWMHPEFVTSSSLFGFAFSFVFCLQSDKHFQVEANQNGINCHSSVIPPIHEYPSSTKSWNTLKKHGYSLTSSTLGTVIKKCWHTMRFSTEKYNSLPAVPSTAKARTGHGMIGRVEGKGLLGGSGRHALGRALVSQLARFS